MRHCSGRLNAVAFAALTLIAINGCRTNVADELEAAAGKLRYRPMAGRISGLPHAAAPASRVADESVLATESHLRTVTRLLYQRGASEAVRARAALLTGDADRARILLEKIVSCGGASGAAWNDYAVALLAGAAPNDLLQLSTAMAATDHALEVEPDLPEALFNRALLLEALSLHTAAMAAYKKYLLVDGVSEWAAEVRERLRKLETKDTPMAAWRKAVSNLERAAATGDVLFINDTAIAFPEKARSWANLSLGEWGKRVLAGDRDGAASTLTVCRLIGRAIEKRRGEGLLSDAVRIIDSAADPRPLARAHAAMNDPQVILFFQNTAAAISLLKQARATFAAYGSPVALEAACRLADATRHTGALAEASRVLDDVSQRVPQRYLGVRAHIQTSRARIAEKAGLHDVALQSYGAAAAAFEALGEEQSAKAVRGRTATLLAESGQSDEVWRLRSDSLITAVENENDYGVTVELFGAAKDAATAGRWDISHALLTAEVESTERHIVSMEALAWRVVAAKRAGMNRTAAAELREARKAEDVPDDDVRLAEILVADDREEALRLLSRSLYSPELKSNPTATAQLLIERARLYRETRQEKAAQHDLESAVALLEQTHIDAHKATMRDAFLTNPSTAYRLLADMLDAGGDTQRALEMLEKYRRRVEDLKRRPAANGGQVPPRTLIITYGVFEERLVIYMNDSRSLRRVVVPVKNSELQRLVSALPDTVRRGDGFDGAIAALSRILIAPIANQIATSDTLVFVPDPALREIPFTALANGAGHYLIQDQAIVIAHGLAEYLHASQRKAATSRALLSVGNPPAEQRSSALPSLMQAEAEAKAIAAMYPSCAKLLGTDATKERVISALSYCDAAHFAVHANAGLGAAMPPHLLLARTGTDDGRLTAAEIAALQLGGIRTVVLAGCHTAATPPGQPDTGSLVDAFLTAGAGSVVGTLWEVQDGPTREMSVAFHRALRAGATPAAALRKAQLLMIERGAPPHVWASLQLYGTGF
jgi:CHAT domain-containing protein